MTNAPQLVYVGIYTQTAFQPNFTLPDARCIHFSFYHYLLCHLRPNIGDVIIDAHNDAFNKSIC